MGDQEDFEELLGRVNRGETKAVLEAVRQNKGLAFRASENNGITLLHEACGNGHLELVQGLLSLGAVVHAWTDNDWDPLMCASFCGHVAVVALLLDHGADPCTRNVVASALALAAWYNHFDVCSLLLHRGADLMDLDTYKCTPLESYGKHANPSLGNEKKEQRCDQLSEIWSAGPHPSQVQRRRDERWTRRYPLMNVLTGCGFRPLAARRLQLEMERLALGSGMPPPEPLDTPQKLHAHLLGQVLSNVGLVRAIASYL